MQSVIYVLIVAGAILMVTNIYMYARFLRTTHDVLSIGSSRDRAWKYLAY